MRNEERVLTHEAKMKYREKFGAPHTGNRIDAALSN